jgi:SAM-dependent methyltransferase
MEDPVFRRDLYRGTAADYERFRVPYPGELVDDLVRRCRADGHGRLLDLACGTGQIGFAVRRRFREVWAVDQEPGMIAAVREKAHAAGAGEMRAILSPAEELPAAERTFDVIAVGNAFHRLPRRKIAHLAYEWLRPGGFLALLWSGNPWDGSLPWQRATAEVVARWMNRVRGGERIPAEYHRTRELRPDAAVLGEAGFRPVGSFGFPTVHRWTPATLIGYAHSTSVLSREALGDSAEGFAADLRRALRPYQRLAQTVDFAYVLHRRPEPWNGRSAEDEREFRGEVAQRGLLRDGRWAATGTDQ